MTLPNTEISLLSSLPDLKSVGNSSNHLFIIAKALVKLGMSGEKATYIKFRIPLCQNFELCPPVCTKIYILQKVKQLL